MAMHIIFPSATLPATYLDTGARLPSCIYCFTSRVGLHVNGCSCSACPCSEPGGRAVGIPSSEWRDVPVSPPPHRSTHVINLSFFCVQHDLHCDHRQVDAKQIQRTASPASKIRLLRLLLKRPLAFYGVPLACQTSGE